MRKARHPEHRLRHRHPAGEHQPAQPERGGGDELAAVDADHGRYSGVEIPCALHADLCKRVTQPRGVGIFDEVYEVDTAVLQRGAKFTLSCHQCSVGVASLAVLAERGAASSGGINSLKERSCGEDGTG